MTTAEKEKLYSLDIKPIDFHDPFEINESRYKDSSEKVDQSLKDIEKFLETLETSAK